MAASLEVDISLGKAEDMDDDGSIRRRKSQLQPQPIRRDYGNSIQVPVGAPNPFLVAVTSMFPAKGRLWELTDIGVFTTDGHTTVPYTPAFNGNSIVLAASGVAAYSNNATPVAITIAGGTVTAIAINGSVTGVISGTFVVPAFGNVTVTYSVAPTTFTTGSVPNSGLALADTYIGPSAGMDAPGDMQSFVTSGNIPFDALIGRDKAYGMQHDRIYAWVYNAPAGTNLTIAGTLLDWRIEDRTEMSI